MMLTFVNSLYFLEYVFLVILNFQVLNDLMNSSSRQLVYLIILSFSMHCFESQLRGRETVRYFTSVARGLVNSRLPRTNPASGQNRGSTWLTRSLWITSHQRSNRSAKLPHPSLFQNYTWSTSYIWSDVQQLKGKWTNKQTNEQNEQIKAKWTLFNNWGLSIQLCQFKTFIS